MGQYGRNVLNVSETLLGDLLLRNMNFGELEEIRRVK